MLVPPQAERFAALTGADLGQLVLNVTGWNKLVLQDSRRVFLFPRSADGVEWFERELAAYRVLALTPLGVVPRLHTIIVVGGRECRCGSRGTCGCRRDSCC